MLYTLVLTTTLGPCDVCILELNHSVIPCMCFVKAKAGSDVMTSERHMEKRNHECVDGSWNSETVPIYVKMYLIRIDGRRLHPDEWMKDYGSLWSSL